MNHIIPPKRRRVCLIICIFSLICSVCVAGCKPNQSDIEPTPSSNSAQVDSEAIQAGYFDVSEYAMDVDSAESILILEDRIVVCGVEYSEEYEEASYRYFSNPELFANQYGPSDLNGDPIYPGSRIKIFDLQAQVIADIDLDVLMTPTDTRRVLLEDPNGGFCILSTYIDFYTREVTYQIDYFDVSGQHVKNTILIAEEYIESIQSVCISAQGKICVVGWGVDYVDRVYVFSSEGKLEHTIEMEPVALPDLILVDDQVYLHASVVRENNYRQALIPVNVDEGVIEEPIIIPEEYPIEYPVFAHGRSCYSFDRIKVVEFAIDTQSTQEIVRWSDTAMTVQVASARVISGQKIACVGFSGVTGMYTISILTSTTVNPILDKQEIVLAGLDIVEDGTVQALVYRFNNTHDDYRIVLRDYSDEISDELTWQQMIPEIRRIMLIDILSENSPDIYLDINANLSLIDYSNKAYLLDLAQYVEDSEYLTEDHYFMSVLTNGREGQGVYFLPTCFSINCFSGFPEVIQGRAAWTFEEFDRIADELPSGINVQSELTKPELLSWALLSSLDEHVDFENLKAEFLEDDFIALLEWANEYGVDEASFSKSDVLHFEYIDSFYGILDEYSFYGRMREYIGFPSIATVGLAYYPRYSFAISSQSEVPMVCWEIVSDALSEEFQTDHIFYANPVNRNAVQNNIDRILIEEKELGSTSFSEEELINISRVYWDVLERTDQMLINSDMIAMVVSEEAAAYFAGQKSADEVAALIQNRVQNMLDERM